VLAAGGRADRHDPVLCGARRDGTQAGILEADHETLKPVHTASTRAAARANSYEPPKAAAACIRPSCGSRSRPAPGFVPLLAFVAKIRTVVCGTNAAASGDARIHRGVRGCRDPPSAVCERL
jgi:hypothetical protein